MKTRIVTLFILFLLISVASAILSFGGHVTRTMVAGLMVCSIVVVVMFIHSWLQLMSRMVTKTSSMATGVSKTSPTWSFENISQIEKDCNTIDRKLGYAVTYISKLSHPEQLDTMEEELSQDRIGNALLKIRDEMHALKIDENQPHWITQGLATFSEILRNKGHKRVWSSDHQQSCALPRYEPGWHLHRI